MMYHEGGFSMGDLTDEDLNCRMFTRDLGAVCVNVEYRYFSFGILMCVQHILIFQASHPNTNFPLV